MGPRPKLMNRLPHSGENSSSHTHLRFTMPAAAAAVLSQQAGQRVTDATMVVLWKSVCGVLVGG
jgi:hypothetical protein